MKDPANIYVAQDGEFFYVFAKPDDETPIRVEECPFSVPFLDMEKAEKAKQWFRDNGYFKGASKLYWLDLNDNPIED